MGEEEINDTNESSTTAKTSSLSCDATTATLSGGLSKQSTHDLLNLLLERGYFHDGKEDAIFVADPKRGNPSSADERKDELHFSYSTNDENCQVVFLDSSSSDDTNSSCCMTYPVLESKLQQELQACGGRANTTTLMQKLRLPDEMPVLRIMATKNKRHKQQQEQSSSNSFALLQLSLFQHGQDVVSSIYLDSKAKQAFDSVRNYDKNDNKKAGSGGVAMVSHIANHDFHLPMDITLQALEERLPQQQVGLKILSLDGGTALVSEAYLASMKEHVITYFASLKEPTTIADICHRPHDHNWDVGLVSTWIQEAIKQRELAGDFHGSRAGGVYTPHAHVQALRQSVDELFQAQGYMTETRGVALGLSKSKMGAYIQESFVRTTVLCPNNETNCSVLLL